MNKKYAKVQSTRRSLIMSILSLMLCFAMLIGTTYAWFTDSVTSGRNKIIAGNLDIALYHNGTEEINENTDNLFDVDLWEPGVICYENFTVKNIGTLALKYAFSLNIYDKNNLNGHDLSEVIKVAVKDGGFNPTGTTPEAKRAEAQALEGYTSLADFQKQGNLLAKGSEHDSDVYGVVLYWEPTDNDNLYNVNNDQKTSDNGTELFIEFGVNLVATQDTVESDSFDNQYDKFASFHVDFTKMTEILPDGAEDLTVKKTGIIEEAKVPAKAANKVFETLAAEAPEGFKGDDTTKELVLTLDVERQETTGTTQKYEIDMTAVMDFIKGSEKTTVTEEVKNFEEYLTIVVNVEPGLDDVNVDHNGKNMIKLNSASQVPPSKVDNGYYHYDKVTGKLTMKTWSLSPFKVIWTNLLTVTPTSSPVYGESMSYIGIPAASFEGDGKWTSAIQTDSHGKIYNVIIGKLVNARVGDEVYIYLDEANDNVKAGVNLALDTDEFTKVSSNVLKYTIKQHDLTLEDGKNKFSFHVVDVSSSTTAFVATIKVNHREPPIITKQPTAESKTVVATGDNISYQWYKITDFKDITTTASNDAYIELLKGGRKKDTDVIKFEDGQLAYIGDRENATVAVHNLKAGDIIKFTKSNEAITKVVAVLSSDTTREYDITTSSYSIPQGATYNVIIQSTSTSEPLGKISVCSPEKLANETGATLSTSESGSYQCFVTDSLGNFVASDVITIQ